MALSPNSAGVILVVCRPMVNGTPTGALRVLRLGPSGAPIAPPITLVSAGVVSPPSVATDTSAAFVGWSASGVAHVIRIVYR